MSHNMPLTHSSVQSHCLKFEAQVPPIITAKRGSRGCEGVIFTPSVMVLDPPVYLR